MLDNLDNKKALLDAYRPLPLDLVKNLDQWFAVELTYTSNALEGNTLNRKETAVVLEKGITIGGKSLREHLEVTGHNSAIEFITSIISQKNISEKDVLKIHNLILSSIDRQNAVCYRNVSVRISGSSTILPNPAKVPSLMQEFYNWLATCNDHPVLKAALAHYKLVTIHPFVDGNGRTARLLMNLILLQAGFPMGIIHPSNRINYINALEFAQTGGALDRFLKLIYKTVDQSLDIYLKAISGKSNVEIFEIRPKNLLKIGDIAKLSQETTATIRYWTKEGLIETVGQTYSGYFLYDESVLEIILEIRSLQRKKLSIEDIKQYLQSFLQNPAK